MTINGINGISSARQKYKKNLDMVDYFIRQDITPDKRYVLKMCDLFFEDHIDFWGIVLVFGAYERKRLNHSIADVDFNNWRYEQLFDLVYRQNDDVDLPNIVYGSEDRFVTVGCIKGYEDIISLGDKIHITQDQFDEYTANGLQLYVIKHLVFTDNTKCRYVICQVAANDNRIYWNQENKTLINEHGEYITSVSEYENAIGKAIEILKANE